MRRIVTAFASTVTAVVLLFSYHTSTQGGSGTSAAVVRPVAPAAASGGSTPAPSPSSSPSTGSSGSAASGSASSGPATYTGGVAQTQWGPVQVAITVENGRITAADAVQVPSGNGRDDEINAVAVPILDQEVVQAQSAQIDAVSGATVTSDGYLSSLQSAIDQAHL